MARMCPQCSEVHFETTTSPMPSQCRKCNADLDSVGELTPRFQKSREQGKKGDTPPLSSRAGKAQFFAGAALLGVAALVGWIGYGRFQRAVEVTVHVVKMSNPASVAPEGKYRQLLTAYYTGPTGTKTYTYPGVRTEGDTFKAYYLPEDPKEAGEERPFLMLLAAAGIGLIGAALAAFGGFRFVVARALEKDYRRMMAAQAA